ncbi:hypothetical protein ACT29H_08635 [Thermophagus sp. OGC60D27]|uniref:hypothetical protein n=1 Tax=Thermophagus sp. OGC60D27 TaxID=3458415 RepID=UPI0040383223
MGYKPFFIHISKYPALVFLLLAIIGSGNTRAQNYSVSATPDSTLMVIGGQMNLTLEVAQTKGIKVVFPQFSDTITKSIEIIEQSALDTTELGNDRISVKKVIRITSFDSGLHYIPPIEFELASEQLQSIKKTNALGLMVVNPFEEVDPQKGITDIKGPLYAPFKLSELYRFLPWIFGGLIVAILIAAGIYFYVKRKNPISAFIREKPKEPAHIIALRELDHLKEAKLWQKGHPKEFHSSLTDILRKYLEHRYGIPAPEQITSEIMNSISKIELPDDKIADRLRQVLELADLVKFAKMEPLPDENDLSLMNAYFFVNQTKYEEVSTPEEQAQELKDKTEKVEP